MLRNINHMILHFPSTPYSPYPHIMLHAHLGHFCTLIFLFFPISSIHGFTSILDVICSSTSYPWAFPTRSKRSQTSMVFWLIRVISKQGKTAYRIRVEEDGTLTLSSEFLKIVFKLGVNIENNGGFKSTSNFKVESLKRDNHKSARITLKMSGLPVTLWCFARQYAAYFRRLLCHSSVDHALYFMRHGKKANFSAIKFWGTPGIALDNNSKLTPHSAKHLWIGCVNC